MVYRDFQGIKLSALGLGAMRLPVIDGDDARINEDAAREMVDFAMKNGINYYDTAWGYHHGNSEIVLGKILADYPRESFYLADKFPGYDMERMNSVKETFERQLEKCGVEYFDFYLLHNVCEMNVDAYLDEKYDLIEYLLEQKRNGRIKHLGCSMHGGLDVMKRFFDAHADKMEFCQLQVNYLDWTLQDAKTKADMIRGYGIPLWVMEPLRGGRLASVSEEFEAKLRELRPDETVPAWAFRFLQSIPEVGMILSGMSNMDQLKANIATFATDAPLNDDEMAAVLGIADEMQKKLALPCTACRYCTEYCPQGLDIPLLIRLYNEHYFNGGDYFGPMSQLTLTEDEKPGACIGCQSCEAVCPQQIKISEVMADYAEKLGSC